MQHEELFLSQNPVGLGDQAPRTQTGSEDGKYFQRPLCVQRWLRNRALLTRKKYLGYTGRFQLLTGLSPERFLEWSKTVESVDVQDLIDRTSLDFKPAIQFCYRVALRSFLSHNGYSLPKTDLQYVPQAWHRGYRREEIRMLLSQLRKKHHKLFVLMAAESGLRSHVLMELRYRHIKEDLDNRTLPVAVRLEPRFYAGKKAAGYTFLGEGSIRLIHECLSEGLIKEEPHSKLIPKSYYSVWAAIHRASRRVSLDPRIQTCHGLRKYFENGLDEANIDHEKKMLIEGHFAGTRAKHYTDRGVEGLREIYRGAYPFINLRVDEPAPFKAENRTYDMRLSKLETQLDRHRVLESRLILLEEELHQLKQTKH